MDRKDAGDETTGGREPAEGREIGEDREPAEGRELDEDGESAEGEEERGEAQKGGRAEAREILDRVGFDPAGSVLTRRQAEVLVLRSRGYTQTAIAEELGTSRPNVSNIESTATENVDKAEETLRVVQAIRAPVRVSIPAGIDIYEVPGEVYEACNRADIKVQYSAPELMKRVLEEARDVVSGRTVEAALTVSVDQDGGVQVRRATR